MQIDTTTLGLAVAAFLAVKFLGKSFDYFFSKITHDKQYMTCDACERLRNQCTQNHAEFSADLQKELRVIRKVVFLLAANAGLSPKDYEDLTQ